MKKLIAFLLAATLILGMTACGTINTKEVAVLWSGDGVVKVPNSLINAMERAMYIESIAYAHYGANGDQTAQTKQALDALNSGCAGLAVELVNPAAAQSIIELAKEKNVPVVFFNCQVDDGVVSGYDQCVAIDTNRDSLGQVQGEMIRQYLEDPTKADRNGDGKISYVTVGEVSASVAAAGDVLGEAVQAAETAAEMAAILADRSDEKGNMVELVITDSDTSALEVLTALQAKDFNTNKLKTHCIPLFTVGADADASAFTNTADMSEEDLAVFIYNAMNIIDAGQMAGTAMEDHDAIALSVSAVLRNLLKGNDPMKDINEATVAGTQKIRIPYTTYTG